MNEAAALWSAALWRACWQGGLTLLAVWLLCRIPRLPAAWQGWLWRLAFLKLLLALVWAGQVALPVLPHRLAHVPVQVAAAPTQMSTGVVESGELAVTPAPDVPAVTPRPESADAAAVPSPPVSKRPSLFAFLLLAWAAGVLWCLGRWLAAWRAACRLRALAQPVEDEAVYVVLEETGRRLGVRRLPGVARGPAPAPLLLGMIRPLIVLPKASSTENIGAILAHELAHIRRCDLLWGWLAAPVQALFYFHPLVWLAAREYRLSSEMAADALTVSAGADPAGYGAVLLDLTRHGGRAPELPAAGISETGMNLRRRLLALAGLRPFTWKRLAVTLFILCVVCAAVLVPWRLTAQDGVSSQSMIAAHFTIQHSQQYYAEGAGGEAEITADGTRIIFVAGRGWQIDGKTIEDPEYYLYDLATGKVQATGLHRKNKVKFNGYGTKWAYFEDNSVLLYDTRTGKTINVSKGIWQVIRQTAISTDGSTIALLTDDPSAAKKLSLVSGGYQLFIYNVAARTLEEIKLPPTIRGTVYGAKTLYSAPDEPLSLSADGKRLSFQVNRYQDDVRWTTPAVYDRNTKRFTFPAPEEWHWDNYLCSLSADGRYLAFQSRKSREAHPDIYLYDMESSKITFIVEGKDFDPNHNWPPAIKPDGRYLAVPARKPDGQGQLFLYNREAGNNHVTVVSQAAEALRKEYNSPTLDCRMPAFNADGRYLSYVVSFRDCRVIPSTDGRGAQPIGWAVIIYDLETGQSRTVLTAIETREQAAAPVPNIAVSPNPREPSPVIRETTEQARFTWGEQYRGLALSVQPGRYTYKIGEGIDAATWLTNFGPKLVDFSISSPDFDHRYALFYADGRPVPKSKFAREVDNRWRTGSVDFTRHMKVSLKQGEIRQGDSLKNLQRWFDITESGSYTLIIMRGIPLDWNGSLIVSNPLKLQFTGGKAPTIPASATAWGNPDDDMALSVTVTAQSGGAIDGRVHLKNVGNVTKSVSTTTFPRYFHLTLFDASGNAVAKTPKLLSAEDDTLPREDIGSDRKLLPGEELSHSFDLRELFHITKTGPYRLVVMRRQGDLWYRGFAISNMATFDVE